MSTTPIQPVRLVDVARAAGVSRPAAGKVLLGAGGDRVRISHETAERIRRIAQEMGYRPNSAARQLNGKGSQVLGIVIGPQAPEARSAFLAQIESETARHGYRLVVAQAPGGSDAYRDCIDDFASRGVDGVVCIECEFPGQDDLSPYILARHRNVVFHTPLPAENLCCISVDRAQAIRISVEHLLRRGCQRIGLALMDLEHHVQRERLRGYTEALQAQQRPVEERLVFVGQGPVWPSPERVERVLDALVEQAGADAVIANNDYWGLGLIKHLNRRGVRVPEEVAVVGCDNLPVGTLIDPELTTVDMQHEAVASRTIRLLVALIEQKEIIDEARRTLIEPKLVVRASA